MTHPSLWELLWDFDPNGLIVVDEQNIIRVVNPAFCEMFKVSKEEILGKYLGTLFEDLSSIEQVRREGVSIKGVERNFEKYGVYARSVVFPVESENLVAAILVDMTSEQQRKEEMNAMKKEALRYVDRVIDKQMGIAQEIASLLGETTAEAKVSLLKIRDLLNEEIHE